MPGSNQSGHHGLIPRASNDWRRGEHPDLWGGLEMPDVAMTPDVEDRDLNRQMADPGRRAHLMQRLAAAQALEPAGVQEYLSGTPYAGTFAQGMRSYVEDRDVARNWLAQQDGKTDYWDDARIAQASLEEYDRAFDAAGQPRDHVYYHQTSGVRLDSGIDPHSGRELGNR